MVHTSVLNEIGMIAQASADQSALNTVYILADWIKKEGYEALADKMLATFIETTDKPNTNEESADDDKND